MFAGYRVLNWRKHQTPGSNEFAQELVLLSICDGNPLSILLLLPCSFFLCVPRDAKVEKERTCCTRDGCTGRGTAWTGFPKGMERFCFFVVTGFRRRSTIGYVEVMQVWIGWIENLEQEANGEGAVERVSKCMQYTVEHWIQKRESHGRRTPVSVLSLLSKESEGWAECKLQRLLFLYQDHVRLVAFSSPVEAVPTLRQPLRTDLLNH